MNFLKIPRYPFPNLPPAAVGVIGLGRTARGAARLLRAMGYQPEILVPEGSGETPEHATDFIAEEIACHFGHAALERAKSLAWAVLSPGIEPEKPLPRLLREQGGVVLSEIELAWRFCAGRVVGITGTNGKTTTTGLIEHMLKGMGVSALACGNIGKTFSEALLEQPEAEVFVVEISSFQLETCREFAPDVAVWTNFSANHLDRYPDIESYRLAKLPIFEKQGASQIAIVQKDSLPLVKESIRAEVFTFSSTSGEADFCLQDGGIVFRGEALLQQADTNLPGGHNAENIAAALAVANALGLDLARAAKAVCGYHPPEHRCEPVAEIGGVMYVNDSKSTNLDALEKALQSQTRPVFLIAGGKDKGFGYASVLPIVRERVRCAILIGQMKDQIAEEWAEIPCEKAADLSLAVRRAAEIATPGSTVLFSPGTSSFDMFRDYEERGRVFKNSVRTLLEKESTKAVSDGK